MLSAQSWRGGNGGTAQTGSASAALRLVAYRNLVEDKVAQFTPPGQKELQVGPQGIGKRQIAEAPDGVPGLGIKKVEEQLANLKTSGHYTRIMQEVSERVEREASSQKTNRLRSRWSHKTACRHPTPKGNDQRGPGVRDL